MIKKKVFYILIIIALCSLSACEHNNTYTYIEVVELNNGGARPVKKFKRGKIFKAQTDSAAYVKAFVDFCSSREVCRRSAASAKLPYWPVDFIIWNENSEDISQSITFHEKKSFEEKVQKDLRNLVLPSR